MNLSKQFIGANQVDESKVRLSNNTALRARNAANTGDVNLIRLNTTDQLMFGDVASPGWQKITFSYSQFSDPSTGPKLLNVVNVPAGFSVEGFAIKSTTSFTGGAVATAVIDIGNDLSGPTSYSSGYDVFAAPTGTTFIFDTAIPGPIDFSASHQFTIQLTVSGANLDQLTAGSLDLYFKLKNMNADAEIGAPGTSNGAKVFPPNLTMSGLTQMLFGAPDREFDQGNYIQSANTFTLSAQGIYLIAASGSTGAEGTNDDVVIGYKINLGPFRRLVDAGNTNTTSTNLKISGLTVEYLGPGDQITFWAQSSINTTLIELEASVTALIGGFGLGNSTVSASQWVTLGSDIYYNVGKVGIGTPTPGYTLDVRSAASGAGVPIGYFFSSEAGGAEVDNIILDSVAGNTGLRITNGNLGLSSGLYIGNSGGATNDFQIINEAPGSTFLHASGNIGLGVDSSGNVGFDRNVFPNSDGTYNNGSVSNRWGIVYAENIVAGNVNLALVGNSAVTVVAAGQTFTLDSGGGFSNSSGNMTVSSTGDLVLNANGGSASVTWNNGGLIPATDNNRVLGSSTNRWANVWTHGINNIPVWEGAGSGGINSTTAVGIGTLTNNTSGIRNAAFGYQALGNNVAGNYNVAMGWNALAGNNADHNIGIGEQALLDNVSGTGNVAIGSEALSTSTGSGNTAVGFTSLVETTGSHNTALGHQSMEHLSTGSYNIGIGYFAGFNMSTGSYNVIIGSNDGATIATSSNNVLIADGSGAIKMKFDSSGNGTLTGVLETSQVQNTSGDLTVLGNTAVVISTPGNFITWDGLQLFGVSDLGYSFGKSTKRWNNAYIATVNSVGATLTLRSNSSDVTWNGTSLDLTGHKVTSLTAGSSSGDAVNYGQTVVTDGTNAMTGALNMGSHKITSVTDPTANQDAATLKWVNDHATYWEKVTLSYTNMNFNNTSQGLGGIGFSGGGLGRVILGVVVKHSVAFTGTGITGTTISLSGADWSVGPFDIHQAASNTARLNTQFFVMDSYSSGYTITASVASTGANLNQLTAGSVDLWILSTKAP